MDCLLHLHDLGVVVPGVIVCAILVRVLLYVFTVRASSLSVCLC